MQIKEQNVKLISNKMLPLLIVFFTAIFFPADRVVLGFSSVNSNGGAAAPAALYVLGDSLFDSGNNNLLPTLAKANFYPYGSDFPGGATGRFTNGRTVADFIAEFLGLPFAPPYLSLQQGLAINRIQASGLNYASASCGILPETGKNLGPCMSLAEQILNLQLTINLELPKYMNTKARISSHLATSLFIISIGSNDYLVNYLPPLSPARAVHTPQTFARYLVNALSHQIQKLYRLGARRILVFELGPIGCIPSITKSSMNNNNGPCVEEVNELAVLYNNQLSEKLKDLSSSLPDATLIQGHVFELAHDAIKNPSAYGFKDTSDTCCITWGNGTLSCIAGLQPCSDPSQRYFWDGFHLTEAVYKMVAEICINNSTVCSPVSLQELLN